MKKTYLLVTDATAAQVEAKTGFPAHDTPLGALLENPKPFNLDAAMRELDRALHPRRCVCGTYRVMHRPDCPEWYAAVAAC